MNNVVIDAVKADRRSASSDSFISGCFSLLRLLQRLAADNPEVQDMAKTEWGEFMARKAKKQYQGQMSEHRWHSAHMLCISSRFSWPDVAAAYRHDTRRISHQERPLVSA
jgi:hypothetical protein